MLNECVGIRLNKYVIWNLVLITELMDFAFITKVFTVALTSVIFTTGQDCPDPVCREEWDRYSFPNPKRESGLCGRSCKDTFICDPCEILNGQAGKVESFCKAHTIPF